MNTKFLAAQLKHGVLLMMVAMLSSGCGRQNDSDSSSVGETAGSVSPNPAEELASIDQVATQEKNGRLTLVDLTKTSPSDIPEAVAALVMLPGVEEVRLAGPSVTDPMAIPIVGIASLKRLRLTDTAISDSVLQKIGERGALQLFHAHNNSGLTSTGLAQLSKLSGLKDLSLSGANVDDGVIESISNLKKLKKLRLRGTGITGDRFDAISKTNIVDLELAETEFGNAGMRSVAAMPKLTKLNLWLTKVDNDGVAELKGKTQLTSLNLDNIPAVSDPAIATILSLPELVFLHLGKTSVTAQGIEQLQALKKLETLHVTNLNIPDDVISRLQSAVPKLKNVVN